MKKLYHLIEFCIQIVFVEHIYGLGRARFKITRIRQRSHYTDGRHVANRTHLVLCSGEVLHIVRSQTPPI